LTLTRDLSLKNGTWQSNTSTITATGTIYFAGGNATFDASTQAGSLNCTGATGTLSLGGTLTITGTTFKLVAGMTFIPGAQLIDLVATAGTVEITSGGKTVFDLRTGNGGAGATYQLQDAATIAQDATFVNGTFQTNNKNFTIGRDLTLSATMGANSVVSGSATVTIGRHLTTNTTAAWHSYGTSLWRMPGDGTWSIALGAGNNTQFYNLYVADAGKIITVNWQNSTAFVINHRMTTGSGSMLKAGTSRANNIFFNAGTSGITDPFHPDPGFTVNLAGASITFETGGGAAPVTLDLYPCNLTVSNVLGTGGVINFQSFALSQNVTIRAMGNITWNADSGFLLSFNDSGSSGAMTKVLDTNGYNISFLGSALINGRDGVNGRAWKFNVANNTTLRLAGYQEYFANIAANRTSVLGNNSVFQVDGNYVYLGGGAGSDRRYTMTATSVIQISGSYSGAAMNTWVGSNTGIVKFTSNAAWSITQNAADQWPNIQITGSGAASIGIFNMASLDCTGASGTITQTGTWTVRTTTFKLVAAQTFVHGNNLIDFTAIAGTVALTTAGKTLGSVRFGNAGAGGTFQLQDAATIAQDANFINGTFQTNNNNLTVNRDLILAGTMGANSFVPGSATVAVGRTFTLVAGAWSTGTCLVDFIATAGTSVITTAGNTLYNTRFGNAGAGGTFQLQGALTITQDVDCVQGTFQANNFNLNVGRDLYFRVTMGAAGFVAGSGTITIPGNLNWLSASLVLSAGTSTFNFTGTGALALAVASGGLVISFYNLTVAAAGQVTSVTGSLPGGMVDVTNIFLTSTGTFTYGGTGQGLRVMSTLANGFQPAATCTINCPITLQPRAVAGTTITIPAHTNVGSMTLIRNLATYGTCGFQTTGVVATGSLTAYGITSAGVQAPTLDLNNNNWTVTGGVALGSGADGMGLCTIGTATLSMTGNLTMVGNPNADSRVLVLGAGGQLLVGGSLQHTGVVATTGQSFVLSGTSSITVGGNWDTAAAKVWPSLNGTVTFTAAGPFTVAESAADIFPNVRVTGGGSSTLPNGFACNIFTITAGLVTAGNPFIVYGTINNGGTLTVSPGTYVGGGITNTGTVISAGSNIFCRGSVCTLTGFNPNNVTMTKDCTELILGSSMTIAGALTVQARPQPPGVIRFLAGGVFAVANLNSQINCTDDAVQMISTVGGTRYNLNVAVLTNAQNLWFRDCNYTGPALVGDLTNINLGNNSGLALNIAPAAIRIDSEDPGLDLLAIAGIGQYSYCWFVDSTLVGLTAKVAAFGTGSNNWHRKTNIPQTLLDNLVLSNTYFIALGLIDDRNRRLVPNVAGGDRISAVANISESGGGGGGKGHLSVNVQIPTAS
jgi:hypothetical protein